MLEFGVDNKKITANCSNAPFLLSIDDNEDNRLRIVIALPKRGEEGEGVDIEGAASDFDRKLNEMLMQSYPVCEDMDNVYQILFDSYIIYQCRNEKYTKYDRGEIRKGKYLIIFEKSRLLEYYEEVIFDADFGQMKSKRKHYGIYTENHIIDVISNEAPIITKI